jgi:hypothetical protein
MKLASQDLQLGQAQSLISIQADCSRMQAMLLLRQHAAAAHEPLIDVAVAVLAHRIRFDSPLR